MASKDADLYAVLGVSRTAKDTEACAQRPMLNTSALVAALAAQRF